MAAFADSFKAEVARIARKEGKDDVAFLRRASATQRGEIAALKKEVKALSTQVKALAKALARAPGAEPASKPAVARRGDGSSCSIRRGSRPGGRVSDYRQQRWPSCSRCLL